MAVNCGPVGVGPGFFGSLDSSWYEPPANHQDGGFTIRICPPIKGKKCCLRIRNHLVGSKTFQCHKEIVDGKWQGECVVCDQYAKFWKDHFDSDGLLFSAKSDKPHFYSGTPEDFRTELQKIKPIERYYFNIIVRGEEDRGVFKWSCGKTIYAKILEGVLGNESNPNVPRLGDVTDPKKGHDLHVRRAMKEVGRGSYIPDYSSSQFLPSTPLGKPKQIELWLSHLYDLTALRILSSKEDMLVALEEVFGRLDPVNLKQKYRSITDPFQPAW